MSVDVRIANLKKRIKEVASEETTHPLCKEEWSLSNPMLGHCAVVAAIFYKKFGGEIIRGIIAETGISHYWNKLNNKEYDLTKEQFAKKNVTIIDAEECSVERILSNPNTLERYNLLLSKLEELPSFSNDHE